MHCRNRDYKHIFIRGKRTGFRFWRDFVYKMFRGSLCDGQVVLLESSSLWLLKLVLLNTSSFTQSSASLENKEENSQIRPVCHLHSCLPLLLKERLELLNGKNAFCRDPVTSIFMSQTMPLSLFLS